MKSKYLTPAFALLVFTFYTIKSHAQTDSCITYLKNANSFYEQRNFDQSIKLLQTALDKCNLDKADKIQAHKLLALSYLGIDNLENADQEAEAIIKINPNYAPDKFKDDPKYSALFDKFKPVPVFRVGVTAGINRTKTDVIKTYSIVHADDASGLATYNSKTGFQLGLSTEFRAYKNLWVQVEGQFRQSSYEHIFDSVEGTTINYNEKLSYFDIPVSAKYYIMDKQIVPFVEAGLNFSILTNALSTTTRDDQKDIVKKIDYRNTFMTGIFGGVGAAYKLKGVSVFIAFRYNYFTDNVNKKDTRYADDVNVFKYYYIDDDFRMDNWQVNVGASYNLSYKNQKIK